jgi:hypothetical protein
MLTSFILLFLVALCNWFVNPYYLFGSPVIEGFNRYKTNFFYDIGMIKSYKFIETDAENIILGSSRAGSALDPKHKSIEEENFYNFATPGSNPNQNYRKFRHAVSSRDITSVIYSADFFTFNTYYSINNFFKESFNNRWPTKSLYFFDPKFLQQFINDYARSLVSFSAIRNSLKTVRSQSSMINGNVNYQVLYPSGLWKMYYKNGRNQELASKKTEGSYLNGNWFRGPENTFSLEMKVDSLANPFLDYRKSLELAHENNVDFVIVILPMHARLLEALYQAGLGDSFSNWKRKLVNINNTVAKKHKREEFSVWDFSSFSQKTTELMSGQEGENYWFYDSSHAHPRFGALILDAIYRDDGETAEGQKITSINIEEWLQLQDELHSNYQSTNKHIVDEIKQTVSDVRDKTPWIIH